MEEEGHMHALEIDNVTKHYGKTVVVKDLSLTVQPGRVTGFLGPNGAGKSTTMKILLDLASADSGQATIGGKRYRDLHDPVRTVGVVLESNAFHPGRSGRNHLRILADASGIPSGRVDDLLQMVELAGAADRKVGGYSLGMRQRLGLAVALLGDPPVLVLDEPGNGLDPGGVRWLRDLLRSRAAEGNTVFVSSHLLAEMEQLSDDLVVIHLGRLVTSGTVSDLMMAATVVRTPSPEPLRALLESIGGTVQVSDDGALLVRGLPTAEIGDRAHVAGIALHELTTQSGSLEDLFLGWTGDNASGELYSNDKEAVSQ
ncbi:MAG: ATP-binding cassette domain-containing protein [Dehalococcoidia bacterium]